MALQKTASLKTAFNPVEVLGKPSEVTAGFFVSKAAVENKAEFLMATWRESGLGAKTPVYLKQVHSGRVVKFLNGEKPVHAPTGDALITDSREAFIVIQVADCLPVLFFDAQRKVIAGAHAGWKGSLLGIAPEVVHQLVSLGSPPAKLKIWFGPSIHACCYEVDVERAVLFPRRTEAERHIDLVAFNQKLLEQAGVPQENIYIDPRCTACSSEQFPSYRRDGRNTGRIFACLALK